MTLIDHLHELKHRLAVSSLAVVLGTVIGFLWFMYDVGPLQSLGDILTGPYCDVPVGKRVALGPNGQCQLLGTAPMDAFMLQMKVGATAGVVFASPIWLYQLWAFITPGLYAKERRFASTFVSSAVVLFVGGAVLAYFVVAKGLEVLLGFGGGQVGFALTGDKYFSFILAMLVVFGVSFELPLLIVMLNRVGVVSYAKLSKWRRGLVFGLFVFAAIATPGQDPFSMLALAAALTILFEIAVQLCRLHDRKKARLAAEQGWDSLDPDESSKLDYTPEPVEPSGEASTAQSTPKPQRVRYDDAT